jgi:heavy-metal-associated domain-containing protein
MKFHLHIAHQVPGRIRIKAVSGKGNPALLDQMTQPFRTIPGVKGVAVNETTGSLILHYDPARHAEFYKLFQDRFASHALSVSTPPATEIDDFANAIEAEAGFLAGRSLTARTVVDFCKSMDQSLRVATNNAVDLKIVVAVGFAGLVLMEIGVSVATPMWVTIAIYALNHLAELNLPDAAPNP